MKTFMVVPENGYFCIKPDIFAENLFVVANNHNDAETKANLILNWLPEENKIFIVTETNVQL
jgi:hypothetical protein